MIQLPPHPVQLCSPSDRVTGPKGLVYDSRRPLFKNVLLWHSRKPWFEMLWMLFNVLKQDAECAIDVSVNSKSTLVTAIYFGTNNLLTIATSLAGVFLRAYCYMTVRVVVAH